MNYAYVFTAPGTDSYHFGVKIYSNEYQTCAIGEANTVDSAVAFSHSLGSTFPVSLTGGQVITVEFDPSIAFANWDSVQSDSIYIIWQYESDPEDNFSYHATDGPGYSVVINGEPEEDDEIELFRLSPNRIKDMRYEATMTQDIVRLGFGVPVVDPDKQSRNPVSISGEFYLRDADDIYYLKDFFTRHNGRTFAFAIPSWNTDLVLAANASLAATAIQVEAHQTPLAVGDNLYFFSSFADELVINKIASISTNGETITLTEGLAVPLNAGQSIALIYRVTFSSDDLRINMLTDSKGTVDLTFVEELRVSGVEQGTVTQGD